MKKQTKTGFSDVIFLARDAATAHHNGFTGREAFIKA